MQLTQSYSSTPEGYSVNEKPSVASKKPKVPNKPSHLTGGLRNVSSLPSMCVDDTVTQKKAKKRVSYRKFSGYDERSKMEENHRKSTSATGSSKQIANATCSDFGDYVEINFPPVEPGTRIRADDFSGEIEILPSCLGNVTPPRQERRKPTGRSASDTSLRRKANRDICFQHYEALITELGNKLRSNSLESLKPSSTADESGYEMPMSFQTPTYMSLDDDLGPFVPEETDAHCTKPKISRNKKIRLARFRRKPLNPNPSPFPDDRLSTISTQTDSDVQSEFCECVKNDLLSSPKPQNSFLSNRIQSISSDGSNGHHHFSLTNRTSLGSSILTCSTCESDCSDDEWSDSSDDEAEYECFYQQINSSSRPKQNHQYETIKEFRVDNHDQDSKSTVKESLALKDSSSNCKLPAEVNALYSVNLSSERKLHKKNFQDLKVPDVRDCTWSTVSTPGVLKLNELKNALKLNFNKDTKVNQNS